MLVQYTHNSTEYIRGCMLNWQLTYKRRVEKQVFLIGLGMVLILLAYANINDKMFTDDSLFAVGLFFCLVSANFVYSIFKQKKVYETALAERSQRLENTTITFNFTNDALLYNDIELSYNLNWNRVGGYQLYKDILMIKSKNSQQYLFIIPKAAIGTEQLNQIIDLLKVKKI